jgi:hypothetical protein
MGVSNMVFNACISRLNWINTVNPAGRSEPGTYDNQWNRHDSVVMFRRAVARLQLHAVSFLSQIGEPPTKALRRRHYSRGRATTL